MAKIRRNAPCPCGSGKKYKKCCSSRRGGSDAQTSSLDAETLARVYEQFLIGAEKESRRREKYGHVRPIISTTVQGYRLVAVGSTLHWSKSWRTVADFLSDYIKRVLGEEWGTNEINTKPREERHPILQWYDSVCRFQGRHLDSKDAAGLYSGEMDGPVAAYLQLAYDLYVMADHQELQESLVRRLKHPDQFQGARYELAVATHCIRAGFKIAHEDETDPSRQHPEFIATHTTTGQAIAVEAKSRHRPGVLGFRGEKEEEPRAGVGNILRKALQKRMSVPYAVFIDLNLPPRESGDLRGLAWLNELIEAVERLPESEEKLHPYNLLMFTNYPEHYGSEGTTRPGADRISLLSLTPRVAVEHPEALQALHEAAVQYGRIPNFFEEEGTKIRSANS